MPKETSLGSNTEARGSGRVICKIPVQEEGAGVRGKECHPRSWATRGVLGSNSFLQLLTGFHPWNQDDTGDWMDMDSGWETPSYSAGTDKGKGIGKEGKGKGKGKENQTRKGKGKAPGKVIRP